MKHLFSILLLLLCFTAQGHSGRTDSKGGHYNRKTGEYHYHNGGNVSTTRTNNAVRSVNSELLLIQKKLNELNFDCGTPDGIMGSKTKQAIKDFQKSKGLVPDGVLGPKTKKELGF